ncbi:MAG: 3-phosphoshikimate 1-carboxyvinyltransferase [Candidatus Omnitrophica bacterium]|nr:3-phosphoshikimate 1-carboxyvinyltransferase [Candidatus Omnitrophota bacterium]
MKSLRVEPALRLEGEIALSGDKSIAHRSIILSAISKGKTVIRNFPTNKDCIYTVKAFRKLGIRITQKFKTQAARCPAITVFGKGLYGLKKPKSPVFVGDSATTLRLILGVLAGRAFRVKLITGRSLLQRPMRRVTIPLISMGVEIKARHKNQGLKAEDYPPVTISGGNLKPITYRMPVASAQVKSAILLAGLYVKGNTKVIEQIKTRDHTERMLKLFKADIKLVENTIVIKGNKELASPKRIYIPGDVSSASFFIVLATILPKAKILIKNLGLNPSRTGIIKVLKRMGAKIRVSSTEHRASSIEPMGDLIVRSSSLKGTVIRKNEVPSLIDELPILMVAASQAKAKTIFEGVGELRVKETDRIRSMSENLKKMGAIVKVLKDGNSEKVVIEGVKKLKGCRLQSFGDHRTAMSMVVAGLAAEGKTLIDDVSCINKSFPDFLIQLEALMVYPPR